MRSQQPPVKTKKQVWLMLAFAPAPYFARSQDGKSWFRILKTRAEAVAVKRWLIELSVAYHCKKIDPPARRASAKIIPFVSRDGFGGKLNATPINSSWRRKQRRA